MKLSYILIIPSLDEVSSFTSMENLRQYTRYWFLSENETNMLIDTLVYRHKHMGILKIYCREINPYFDGHKYEL